MTGFGWRLGVALAGLGLTGFIALHLVVTAVGTAGLWWFVFPAYPAAALADGISAGAIAGYVEIVYARWNS
jgi:hypothetical protein